MSNIVLEIRMDTLNLTRYQATNSFRIQCHTGFPNVTDDKIVYGKKYKAGSIRTTPIANGGKI